jgi:hypothetical protein
MRGNIKIWNQKLRHQRYVHRKRERKKQRKKNAIKTRTIIPKKNEYTSKVLMILRESHFELKEIKPSSIVELAVPNEFCFSRNPDESIYFLRKLYTFLISPNVKSIHFNHFTCTYMGVCASTVMDIIVMECMKYRQSINSKLVISGVVQNGKVSDSAEVDQLVKMSGLLNHLHVTKEYILPNIEKLPIIQGKESSEVASRTIDYFDRSLKRHGYQLTKLGKNHFGTFLGEIVDNCKNHAGKNAIWFTLGHYSFNANSNTGNCKLTILDFGDTIYESLKYHSSKKILKRINKYTRKRLISFRSIRNEETLFTFFSLQQRVSRIVSNGIV